MKLSRVLFLLGYVDKWIIYQIIPGKWVDLRFYLVLGSLGHFSQFYKILICLTRLRELKLNFSDHNRNQLGKLVFPGSTGTTHFWKKAFLKPKWRISSLVLRYYLHLCWQRKNIRRENNTKAKENVKVLKMFWIFKEKFDSVERKSWRFSQDFAFVRISERTTNGLPWIYGIFSIWTDSLIFGMIWSELENLCQTMIQSF